ncbi:hypothetical protein [Pedobacter foliorum]|uniref:hypothetical protein n=1 Tax=Pedobacter foliorum TaxID=2739058 RepID=UPI00156302F6|nr:hypothetical protein [Pedobacter foliorum]NRF40123.1 hypothetical protein [Pedobacter foliorum]
MKLLKFLFLFSLLFVLSCTSFAQKQTFDVVSYAMPKGWQELKNDAGIQLSFTDKKTGDYAIAVITKVKASDASTTENFDNDWLRLVKGSVQVNAEPMMQESTKQNGWAVISGEANYTDGANTGMATLLTATAGRQTISVVLMTNNNKFQEEILAFINSLELAKPTQSETGNLIAATKINVVNPAMVGLWIDYNAETTGNYVNGNPQYTAGYTRKEYAFYPNGTYLFRRKQWMTSMKEILFVYETGTYSLAGNQLTINPKKGMGEWWSKAGQQSDAWGTRLKAADYKMEKVTYAFELKYFSGSQDHTLILKPLKPTQRDGGSFNNANDPYEFHYSLREKFGSLIDNPPGFKL